MTTVGKIYIQPAAFGLLQGKTNIFIGMDFLARPLLSLPAVAFWLLDHPGEMNMSRVFGFLVFLAAAATSAAAHAGLWNFSYTFDSGKVVRGSFTGDANGDYVENIGNIALWYEKYQFVGYPALFAHGYNFVTHRPDETVPARISARLELSNFTFSDAAGVAFPPYDPSNVFGVQNDPDGPLPSPFVHVAIQADPENSTSYSDMPGALDRWFLGAADIPEPASASLLGLALLGMGWVGRRQRQG